MGRSGTADGAALQPTRAMPALTLLGVGVSVGMLALGAVVLLQLRWDAWHQAEQAADNLALALERDIARNIAVYDLSLQGAIGALQLPGLDDVSPEIRRAAIFDRAASADDLGSLLVLDSAGDVLVDSASATPPAINFADRDFFKAHQARSDGGLFVSRPYRSQLRNGEASIAISRRVAGRSEWFDGVAVGELRLSYFHNLFARLQLGSSGSVALFLADGHTVARSPSRASDFDRDISQSTGFQLIGAGRSGHYTTVASADGVERLYSFRHVGDLPLVLTVGLSVADIYAAWWDKASVIGGILAILCAGTVALCVMFRLEMARRIAAETALVGRAETLAVMAATDGLTGLANRRAFEGEMFRAWRHAIRSEEPLSLLMIDADHFKLYNDGYGHPAGDRVLRAIATCIQRSLHRPRDLGARYGGEEFVVLLPDTAPAGAAEVAERIRVAVADLAIPHGGSGIGAVSVSIGVVAARPTLNDREAGLLKQADQALYQAKRDGRNRVVVAPSTAEVLPDWAASLAASAA